MIIAKVLDKVFKRQAKINIQKNLYSQESNIEIDKLIVTREFDVKMLPIDNSNVHSMRWLFPLTEQESLFCNDGSEFTKFKSAIVPSINSGINWGPHSIPPANKSVLCSKILNELLYLILFNRTFNTYYMYKCTQSITMHMHLLAVLEMFFRC